jgi:Bax protein
MAFGCEPYPEHPEQFYPMLYPMVQALNTQMILDHQSIVEAYQQWQRDPAVPPELSSIITRYHVTALNTSEDWRRLLEEAAPIPIQIVLAQAALESSYGRAHLARKSCNLFGLRCYTPGCGAIPADRPEHSLYAVRTFPTIEENLSHYYHVINTHTAYQPFREKRADHASIEALIASLTPYAGIGGDYPKRLEHIIHKDHLNHYAEG